MLLQYYMQHQYMLYMYVHASIWGILQERKEEIITENYLTLVCKLNLKQDFTWNDPKYAVHVQKYTQILSCMKSLLIFWIQHWRA